MILNTDLLLYDPIWERADNELCSKEGIALFNRLIDVFLVACAIGVKEDQMSPDKDCSIVKKTIGRTTYMSMSNTDLHDCLDFILQNALINSKKINYTMDERLKLAFNPDYSVKELSAASFLVGFANYGIEQIFAAIDSAQALAAIDEVHNYLNRVSDHDFDDLLASITLGDLAK